MLRNILIILGGFVVLILALVASVAIPFMRYASPKDGAVLPGGAMLVSSGGSNIYVIPDGPSHVVLVDCGMDAKMTGVAAALQRSGLRLDAVEAVIITHAHPDHIGGCGAVPGAKLYAMDREADAIEGSQVVPGPISSLTFAKPKATGLHVARRLADGENFSIGSVEGTAYAVPGHTPGSGAYLIGPVLFVGDAVAFGKDGKPVSDPWIFDSDRGQVPVSSKALAARLKDAGITAVATGHSAPGQILDME